MAKFVMACLILGALRSALGFRKDQSDLMSIEALVNFTRANLVSKLGSGYHAGLQAWAHNAEQDGLIWSGTSRYPGFVFKHGFKKDHYKGTKYDMGEDVSKWAQQIKDSITKNTRSWGFHFTTSPKVAGQFGVLHASKAKMQPYDDCEDECDDAFGDDCDNCVRGLLKGFQTRFGCPAPDAPVWDKAECWEGAGKDCLKADRLSETDKRYRTNDFLDYLCPNWGYAYVVKAEGVHVRVNARDAYGKDYSSEEEVYVPMGVEPDEILGAIPIYARKAYDNYGLKNPGLTNFEQNWNGVYGWKQGKMAVPPEHTKDGHGSENGIGAFIYNPNYNGGIDGARKEMEKEFAKKRIASDIGTAIPREAP